MSLGNSVCDDCKERAPDVFCQCSAPETLLCLTCLGKHVVQNPRKAHISRPFPELQYYKIPGYFERLDIRIETFSGVYEEVWGEIGDMDEVISIYVKTRKGTSGL